MLLAIAIPAFGRLKPEQRAHIADSLRRELSKVTTPADSLPILYDIYDLSSRDEQKKMAWQILHTGQRADDLPAIMDMLRQLGNFNIKSDTTIKRLISINAALPENEVQKGTNLYLNIMLATHNVQYLSEAERQKLLTQALVRRETKKSDLFSDIQELYTLALYLGGSSKGGMYKDYVDRLNKEIERLPAQNLSVRNLFYTSSATYYAKNFEYERSLEADRQLLKNVSNLEKRYSEGGRKYRNFDMVRYTAYRRMLCNYKALTLKEVDSINNLALALVRINPDVKAEHESNPRERIYWLMAHKEYAQAIPLIKTFLTSQNDDNNNDYRLQLLRMLKEAATATGDNATLLFALKEYNDQLEEYFRLNAEGIYRELQVRYDVNELKSKNHQLDIQTRDLRLATERQIILVSVIGVCILLLLVILIHRRYTNMRIRCRDLEEQLEEFNVDGKSLRDIHKDKLH